MRDGAAISCLLWHQEAFPDLNSCSRQRGKFLFIAQLIRARIRVFTGPWSWSRVSWEELLEEWRLRPDWLREEGTVRIELKSDISPRDGERGS